MTPDYQARLQQGCAELDVDLDTAGIARLLQYHQLLIKWNNAYNLTAVRDPLAMIDRHLVDSLTLLEFLTGDALLDMGTGAGLPGMVVALVNPERSVWLLDSNGKKTRFLQQVKLELELSNVTVVQERIEQWQPGLQFSQITARAFTSLSAMVAASRHLLAAGGRYLAMKGQYPAAELADLPGDIALLAVTPMRRSVVSGERHLVTLAAG